MLGAIFGDIVGSVYESHNVKSMDFPLLSWNSQPTDDSIMAIAVATALMNAWGKSDDAIEKELVRQMQAWGRKYPYAGYGGYFAQWLMSRHPKPYGSFGNGSGMRVSPVGWLYTNLEDTMHAAKLTAEVTHSHSEGIRGAQAIAGCIFLARAGASKEEIRTFAEEHFQYNLSQSIEEMRPTYHFNETCQGSVPQAIRAFYESRNYEDAIRRAVSLGGDSDTIACMTGGIAEAFYGMPEELKKKALEIMDKDCASAVKKFQTFCHHLDRRIPASWREDVFQVSEEKCLQGNWLLENAIHRLYREMYDGDRKIPMTDDAKAQKLDRVYEAFSECIQHERHFLVPIACEEEKTGFLGKAFSK